ncbi:protoporphyrinogen oxidase HemJ [bacterium]|nr:protoporphyrinogen oxidase HemJ [bacterium]
MPVSLYLWVKAIHVIAVIAWMAAMLYLPRLYVYHAMETDQTVMDRFQVMERRLLRAIMNPAMIVSLLAGLAMIGMNPALLKMPWFHVKLTMLVGMFACHGIYSAARKKLIANPHYKSDKYFRILNEVPTLLMIIIVIMVIVRPF